MNCNRCHKTCSHDYIVLEVMRPFSYFSFKFCSHCWNVTNGLSYHDICNNIHRYGIDSMNCIYDSTGIFYHITFISYLSFNKFVGKYWRNTFDSHPELS